MSKEFLSSLPEVMDHYSQCNLLLPTSTDVQLNPFYKFHVEEVPVDLGENSGDIFKVGSVDSGKKDRSGNTIWVSAFSLTKPMLNKLAMAAGIQFNPKETYGERIDKYTYRAQAQGAMSAAWRKAWYVRWKKRKTRIREYARCAEKSMTEFLHFPERTMKHLSVRSAAPERRLMQLLVIRSFLPA